ALVLRTDGILCLGDPAPGAEVVPDAELQLIVARADRLHRCLDLKGKSAGDEEISRDRLDDIAGIAFDEQGRAGAAVHPHISAKLIPYGLQYQAEKADRNFGSPCRHRKTNTLRGSKTTSNSVPRQ